jgi:hypothetical protein
MADYKDIRIRFEMAMNEDFGKAIKRLADLEDQVSSMEPAQAEIVTKEVNTAADYIERFGPISEIKSYFVDIKGFSEGDFKRIESILKTEKAEDIEALKRYIANPKPIEYFISIKNIVNLPAELSKETGISSKFAKQLFAMDGQMKSGKGVGRGELFLGFMIDGATNASVGDVNANGQPYEVKAKDARLNTQNGFGNGRAAIMSFFDGLAKYNKNLAVKYRPESKEDFASFNYKKGGTSRFYDLLQDAVNLKLDLKKIYQIQAETMYCSASGIWSNGDAKIKKMIVDNLTKNVNKDGSPKDDEALNYEFMYINIIYYQTQEFFNGIFLIDPKSGKFAYFNPSIPTSSAVKWLAKNTKYTQPSWQDNPTSNCWKISLR